jgi:hypothetical protein
MPAIQPAAALETSIRGRLSIRAQLPACTARFPAVRLCCGSTRFAMSFI